MRLFHRTGKENATAILRDGFKDNLDSTGENFRFGDQIPPITDVWFSDIPLDANEGIDGTKWGSTIGDAGVLLLLEIPDEVIEQLPTRDGFHGKIEYEHTPKEIADMEEFGAHYQEYLIPAEVANQYGPPIDVSDDDEIVPHPHTEEGELLIEWANERPNVERLRTRNSDPGAFMGDFDIGESLGDH